MLNINKKLFCIAVLMLLLIIFPVFSERQYRIGILDFNVEGVTEAEMKVYVYLSKCLAGLTTP